MRTSLTSRSRVAPALAVMLCLTNSCIFRPPLGVNPILATGDQQQRVLVAQHLSPHALSLFGPAAASYLPLLGGRRAFALLAVFVALAAIQGKSAGAAATSDPVRVYMTLDDNTLASLNPETGAILSRTPLGQQPTLIAASPSGDFLAISNSESNSVSVVNTADNRVTKTIQLESGSAPYGVAVSADARSIYVVNEAKNSISVLDVGAGRIASTISTPGGPSKITLTPDGTSLWVPTAAGQIHVIDTLSNTVSNSITGIPNPVAVAFNPTGTRAYVTSAPQGTAGTVAVVDTANYSVLSRISVGVNPYSIVLSPGGTKAYVSNFDSDSISVIDTATAQVTATMPTSKAPIEVAIVN